MYLRGAKKKKKNYKILDIVQTWGGSQGGSQTFYQKKVWTYFKGEGGSKGLFGF